MALSAPVYDVIPSEMLNERIVKARAFFFGLLPEEQEEAFAAMVAIIGLPPGDRPAAMEAMAALRRASLRKSTQRPVLRGLDRRKVARVAVRLGSVLQFLPTLL
jgi:hypothetical protein